MFQNVILTQQVSSEACRYLSQYIHIGRIFYPLAYTNNIIINFWIIEYKVFFLHYLSGRMMCGRAENRRATCPITLPRHFSGKTLYVAVPGQEQITRTITSWLLSKFHKRIFLTHSSSLIFECIAYSSSPSLWSIRLEGGGGGWQIKSTSWLLNAATVFDSMAAAGREFQSGIVRCQKEFCPSVVLALMCL